MKSRATAGDKSAPDSEHKDTGYLGDLFMRRVNIIGGELSKRQGVLFLTLTLARLGEVDTHSEKKPEVFRR